ncbi:exodeoxyribonuclease VII small subunit [Candidatus Saccharibacteria bacterium]|nr:exodeoxyribonuclease VII small subunit [Candidatus Saccharibacteria bacterium]
MVKARYQELNSELEDILVKLQSDSLDIDEAVKLHERGTIIVKELEAYLKNAENKVAKIKASFE